MHSGEDVGCVGTAGYYGSLGSVHCGPRSVCTARTEFAHRLVRGPAYPGSLGGYRHLVVHDAEHGGFQHLGFYHGTFHYNDRLVRKGYLTFSHGIDVPCELHLRQEFPESGIFFSGEKPAEEVFRHFAQTADHLQHFFHAAYDGPVVVFRGFPVKEIEYGGLVLEAALVE